MGLVQRLYDTGRIDNGERGDVLRIVMRSKIPRNSQFSSTNKHVGRGDRARDVFLVLHQYHVSRTIGGIDVLSEVEVSDRGKGMLDTPELPQEPHDHLICLSLLCLQVHVTPKTCQGNSANPLHQDPLATGLIFCGRAARDDAWYRNGCVFPYVGKRRHLSRGLAERPHGPGRCGTGRGKLRPHISTPRTLIGLLRAQSAEYPFREEGYGQARIGRELEVAPEDCFDHSGIWRRGITEGATPRRRWAGMAICR